MSDAPAAPAPENGVPPVAQDSRTSTVAPGFKVSQSSTTFRFFVPKFPPNQVFAGNLAYSTTDEGLKDFFAPVENDM